MTTSFKSRRLDPKRRTVSSALKRHLHHFVFILTILSLAALLAWWTVFIRSSIRSQKSSHLGLLKKDMKYIALLLGSDPRLSPSPGVLDQDQRFELILCRDGDAPNMLFLKPHWPEYCIRIRDSIIARIEAKYERQNFMLVGEAAFFGLVLLLSSFFLYRFIQLERRTGREVARFWERTAHEIKTPITGIKAFLQNLKSRSSDAGELARYVDMALKQVSKQEQLADNIVSGFHLKSRTSSGKLEKIRLKEYLCEYFRKSALHIVDASLHLDFRNKSEIAVLAQSGSLKIILDNIVDNAIKYCTPGLDFAVDTGREKKEAVVKLRDNGPGIPKKFRETVFQAFRHPDRELPVKRQGTGMGLYIARQMARRMGGDLRVSSEDGVRGSEFVLVLQTAKSNAA